MNCVLLVDEHARVRAELEAAIPGVGVAEVESLAEAEEALAGGGVDLLLLNAGLGDPETLARLRGLSDAVIVTLGPDEVAGVKTMRNGADDFIDWPADPATIGAVVRAGMCHRRIRRTAARMSGRLEQLNILTGAIA